MADRYKVRRAGGTWAILNPAGDTVATVNHYDNAVWLAKNFADRAEVRRLMRGHTP